MNALTFSKVHCLLGVAVAELGPIIIIIIITIIITVIIIIIIIIITVIIINIIAINIVTINIITIVKVHCLLGIALAEYQSVPGSTFPFCQISIEARVLFPLIQQRYLKCKIWE